LAQIAVTRDAFRGAIGGGTVAGANGSFGGVRREINWDGVPDLFAAPNNLPANFFNVNSPRGVVFSTPGTGFQVSANAGVAPAEFGQINPTYPGTFGVFSPQRLFTALGSTVTDVTFFLAGTATPARTSAFGAIFTDVDVAGSSIVFFDALNTSLGVFAVPSISGSETFSFLGVVFDSPVVSRVRIVTGTAALGPNDNPGAGTDVAVLDDFIYGEPTVPSSGFTDDPLVAGTTVIKAVHVTELRTRIDAQRTRFNLLAFEWTDPSLPAGVAVKVVHIFELRKALQEAYTAAGKPVPTFTDSPLAPGVTLIREVHVKQLRDAVLVLEGSSPSPFAAITVFVLP
jgi:hypothetical protein